MEVPDVALKVIVLPETHRSADACLVDNLQVLLDGDVEQSRARNRVGCEGAIDDSVIQKPLVPKNPTLPYLKI